MSAALGKRNGEGEDAESQKRLKTISIPQQFSWTGLKKSNSCNTSGFAIEGLVLWNVLGFGLAGPRDYACFTVVNKEWNGIVKALVPPALFRMKAASERTGNVTVEDVSLLDELLRSLENRESSLYRKDSSSDGEDWPLLQPQYNLIMMRFVYKTATQRNPNNLSREVYGLVCNYLQEYSAGMAHKMLASLKDTSVVAPLGEKLESLLGYWNEWNAFVGLAAGVASYLNRYYVEHHSLKTIQEHAQDCLETGLLNSESLDLASEIEVFLRRVRDNMDSIPPSLLIRAFCNTQTPSPRSPVMHQWLQIKEEYAQIKASVEELMNEQKETTEEKEDVTGRCITILFPNGTKLRASAHFVKSSSFLSHLKLRKGDVLRWDEDGQVEAFAKAIEFYSMDEETPMTPITLPLISSDLSVLVGPQYADFVLSMPDQELLSLVALVDCLNLEKLLDLGVTAISILMKERNAAELREICSR